MQDKPTKKFQPAAKSEDNPRIDKIIHLQSFTTKAVNQFKVKAQYIPATREINIGGALHQVQSQGFKIQNSQIFFQNTQMKTLSYLGTFPFQGSVYLKHEFCPDTLIKLKYKKVDSPKNITTPINTQIPKLLPSQLTPNAPTFSSQKPWNPSEPQNNTPVAAKSERKNRTVNEVLTIVKNWKSLQIDATGQKIRTCAQAAQIVGICKKTVQDYAHHIQFGYQFNFDFEANKLNKIGALRAFVKNKKKQLAILNNIDNYWSFQSSNSDQDHSKPAPNGTKQ